jgi:two-component SAPR family response regulator
MRILVADDDRRVRLALRLFLEERGMVVVGEAASAQEIDPLVQGLRPDLVLLDWELPGLPDKGSAEVPAWANDLRVVALSSRPVTSSDPFASPIQFVCKTDSPDRLIAALCPSRSSRREDPLDGDGPVHSGSDPLDPSPTSGSGRPLPPLPRSADPGQPRPDRPPRRPLL